jgi:Rrf2 family transcriptional regulator, iron-sulfur cluster assembly transcription factor
MRLTRASEYGIRALLYLAQQPAGKVCFISEISLGQDVPEKFLAKILQTLTKGGIVKSHRGVKGGFSLARPAEDVTLKDIVECLEGPVALNKCLIGPDACDRSSTCPVHPIWQEAQRKLLEVLAGASLKSLADASLTYK